MGSILPALRLRVDFEWLAMLLLCFAAMRALSFCASDGIKKTAGLMVDDREQDAVFCGALWIWVAAVAVVVGIPFVAGRWIIWDEMRIFEEAERWLSAASCASLGVFFHIGLKVCFLRAGKGTYRAFLVGGVLALAILIVVALPWWSGLALCALGIAILFATRKIRFARMEKRVLSSLLRASRAAWFVNGAFLLPGALVCVFWPGAVPMVGLGMIWSAMGDCERLDAAASERHIAHAFVFSGLPLLAFPAARVAMGAPEWAALWLVLSVGVKFIGLLDGRYARYGWVVAGLLAAAAATGWVPNPYGWIGAAVLLLCLMGLIRRFIYAAWLPIRARMP